VISEPRVRGSPSQGKGARDPSRRVREADLAIAQEAVRTVGREDAGALAATRALGLARLVSTDRDFARAPERRTPREFLLGLRERPEPGRNRPEGDPPAPSSLPAAQPADRIQCYSK
jgi:hypothetical protein